MTEGDGRAGAKVQCAYKSCPRAFHPSCGIAARLLGDEGPEGAALMYCPKHSKLLRAEREETEEDVARADKPGARQAGGGKAARKKNRAKRW